MCIYVGKITELYHFTGKWEIDTCDKFKQWYIISKNKTFLDIEQTPTRVHKMQKKNLSKTDPILEIHSGNLSLIMMQLNEITKPYT